MNRSRLNQAALALLACLPLLASAGGNDISKVNGTIQIDAGQQAGDVETVNGSIRVESGASIEDASTVNGSITLGDRVTAAKLDTVNGTIRLGDGVKARSMETVNGSLRVGTDSRIEHEVSAVNGSIDLAKNAEVGGKLSTVNGRMDLDAAHVVGRLETVNGNITVGADSRVDDGILVQKPNFSMLHWQHKVPKIIIGPNATVQGTLKFEHEVELYVSDTAKVGRIEGATPIKFSGEHPSDADRAKQQVER
jgi:DUF4097 and DUF4098 domain-containing protein YvlB